MQRSWVRFGIASIVLVAAVLLRRVLDPVMGDSLPLVTLFGAVAIAVWAGGVWAAILAAAAGYVACAYLFIQPRGELGLANAENLVGFAAYLFTCTLIILIGHAMRRAQADANERREVLRVTLSSIGDAVVTTDNGGRVTYLNSIAESLTGWKMSEAQGQSLEAVFNIVNEDTGKTVESPVTRALREGVVVGLANHTLLVARDGTRRPIDDSAAPIRDESGNIVGCVLIFRDVTEQRRMERDRAQQLLTARLLAAIVESSDDAIVSKSLNGIIQSWNAAAERLFGHTAAQAIGQHISLVIPPERIAEEDTIVASLVAGRRIEHFETLRRHRDGHLIAVSLTISPIYNDAGQVSGASKIVRDISARKVAEAERDKFVTLIESSTDFIGMCDLKGTPFFINKAGLERVGLDSLVQGLRTPLREFFFPEDRRMIMDEFLPAVLENGRGEIEVRFRHFKTGEAVWMVYKVVTVKDSTGRPTAFATVSQDVTERRRLEDHLRRLASELSVADRRKNEFLATLAHELRNPLAPLSNMLEVLRREDADAATRREARDIMDRQLRQLVRLVDDLLDLNRITHNRLELRHDAVNLTTVINQAVEASRPLAEAAGQHIVVSLPPEPVWLRADPARLAQVFGNLLNNGSRYSPDRATITVSARREGADVIVTVHDTGIGIAPDKLDDIFEMFTQLDRSHARAQGGLGIGLTLAKQLVTMHGGTLEARSAGAGQGSEFIVRLPALASAPTAAAGATESPKSLSARRILVVDDNVDSAVSLSMLLDLSGNETHVAHDGPAAVAAAQAWRPEIVLLDIGLPEMNGYDVCRRIRALPSGADAIVIALTGWGQEDDRRRSQEAGFDGHLVKPVDPETLMKLLESLAESRAPRPQAFGMS